MTEGGRGRKVEFSRQFSNYFPSWPSQQFSISITTVHTQPGYSLIKRQRRRVGTCCLSNACIHWVRLVFTCLFANISSACRECAHSLQYSFVNFSLSLPLFLLSLSSGLASKLKFYSCFCAALQNFHSKSTLQSTTHLKLRNKSCIYTGLSLSLSLYNIYVYTRYHIIYRTSKVFGPVFWYCQKSEGCNRQAISVWLPKTNHK